MTQEKLARRKERSESQPMMIVKTGDGYRVHSARNPSQFYHVTWQDDGLVCTCPDAHKHRDDPSAQCKHVFAVLEFEGKSPSEALRPVAVDQDESEERAAIQAEGTGALEPVSPDGDEFPAPEETRRQPAHMLVKRSLSPDGRIDAVSIEIDFPVEGDSTEAIKVKAARALQLQTEIAEDFLGFKEVEPPEAPQPVRPQPIPQHKPAASDQPVPARMRDIGVMNGRFGPRHFITVEVNGQATKLFGSPKQIVAHIASAGYALPQAAVADGLKLDIPCRVITKPSADGRYLNIERIFPAQRG